MSVPQNEHGRGKVRYALSNHPYEHKAFSLELKSPPDDAGRFEGYAAVFGNVDEQSDVIDPGAFTKSLQSNPQVPILWQHNPDEPIGVSVDMREDGKGLHVVGELALDVQRAREARALMVKGALRGLSIGYRAPKFEIERQSSAPHGVIRRLKEIVLFEWSPVTFPANPLARVGSVKHDDDRDPELIDALYVLLRTMRS